MPCTASTLEPVPLLAYVKLARAKRHKDLPLDC